MDPNVLLHVQPPCSLAIPILGTRTYVVASAIVADIVARRQKHGTVYILFIDHMILRLDYLKTW